jgi:DegV family protein with EDD domain
MTVKIVADSVSDIAPDTAAGLGITVVPLQVIFSDRTYRDGVDLTTDEFYANVDGLTSLPTTSTPPPQVFSECYESLADEADGILVITIGSRLSATGQAALQAVEMMRKKCRVEVVVSEMAMMAEGLLAIAAAKAAQKGAGLGELVELTRQNISRAGIRLAFDTLKYLERGGRIGKAQAVLGSLLKINPVIGMRDGEVFPFSRERSRVKAIDRLVNFAMGYSHIDELAVEYAMALDEAEMIIGRLGARFPRERIYRSRVGSVIGAHTGPSLIVVTVLGDK